MENYFVVIQLPYEFKADAKGKIKYCKRWKQFAENAGNVKLKIISRRKDTGVSEEVRSHTASLNSFAAYILLNIKLSSKEIKNEYSILKKAAIQLRKGGQNVLVDANDKFSLHAFEA